MVRLSGYRPLMRLIVARCEVVYVGRTTTALPDAVRLLMCKGDGTFMVWADGGSPNVKPLNWMTPPTVLTEERGSDGMLTGLVVRKQRDEERLEIAIAEVLTDVEHELDVLVALEKEGIERELQELLAGAPHWCGEGFRLVRREWPTDIGPVDLMCRDTQDEWVAVEIKRIATLDSVEQLTRYLERIRVDPAMAECRGVLVAKHVKPQARVLAAARGIDCVEIDVEVLRGNREPELRLFAA
ncbi:MAG TPA: endonuclease NucS [Solirubrobacteraceae bacterium]|nr:endonuclease NucS [Solirubrobacteraceae bacterium]